MRWLVYRLTKSELLLGVVGFASDIPVFFLAPIAGVLALLVAESLIGTRRRMRDIAS